MIILPFPNLHPLSLADLDTFLLALINQATKGTLDPLEDRTDLVPSPYSLVASRVISLCKVYSGP